MKILITGIDGFLGRAIAEQLLACDHTVIGLSNGAAPPGITAFHCVDITDGAAVETAINEAAPELCIHLAAMANADVERDKEQQVRRVNVDGSINLVNALIKSGARGIIYFSTVKVLGETCGPEGIDETDEPHPDGIYAQTKLEVERYLRTPAVTQHLQSVVVRPVPVIGIGDAKGNYAKMLSMVEKGFFPLPGDSSVMRSIVFVDSVAARICKMVNSGIINGRTYVFSDGIFLLSDIVNAMRSATGFSFCPTINTKFIKPIEAPFDAIFNRVFPRKMPIARILSRLTAPYFVHTHLFEADYGSVPPVDLNLKIKEIVEWKKRERVGTSQNKNVAEVKILRVLDIVLAGSGLWISSPLFAGALLLGLWDTGSPIFIQERVGRNQRPFRLVKFRTMKTNTKSVASHLADTSSITPLGRLLRRTKLDELPQLINVLKGDMSIVGPRPNLPNQLELIQERQANSVYKVLPGITGLAQINSIDMSTPRLLAQTDRQMVENMSVRTYFYYIAKTLTGNGSGDAATRRQHQCPGAIEDDHVPAVQ